MLQSGASRLGASPPLKRNHTPRATSTLLSSANAASFHHTASRRQPSSNLLTTTTAIAAATATTLAPSPTKTTKRSSNSAADKAERTILECLAGVTGRGKGGMSPEAQQNFEAAVAELENNATTAGVSSPTTSPLLPGRWRLLYTSRPGTASPIQRTFTGVESFSVYQEVDLPRASSPSTATATNASASASTPSRVNNVVDFGPTVGLLRVEAEASTDSRPLPGFTPREGKGLPFGILGVSNCDPPARPNMRIDFQFDKAAFNFNALPFSIPYPVPFRLLGDERKGWIDVTYMNKSGTFRLSRGNKGTNIGSCSCIGL